jgi:hypothetical protein
LTYHNNNFRTGLNDQETRLTPDLLRAGRFKKLFPPIGVDGPIYGQPLYVSNLLISGQMHNVVFVATEADTVYAFDADDGGPTPLWSESLLSAAHGAAAGATTVGGNDPDINCPIVGPQFGITSTPVIDLDVGTIYVEARSRENGQVVHRLHALDIATGHNLRNVEISTDSFDPKSQHNRPGLLLANGTIYIAFASNGCDDFQPPNARYHGWILAYDASSFNFKSAVNTTPTGKSGGVWMSGAGLAADDDGNLFFATGNGSSGDGTNFGGSILKLGGDLTRLDYFTPWNQAQLNSDAADVDVGSGGVLLLPNQNLLAQAGKEGTIYLIDRGQMTTDNGHFCDNCP